MEKEFSKETESSEAHKCLLREKREKIGGEKAQVGSSGGGGRDRQRERARKKKATWALEVV